MAWIRSLSERPEQLAKVGAAETATRVGTPVGAGVIRAVGTKVMGAPVETGATGAVETGAKVTGEKVTGAVATGASVVGVTGVADVGAEVAVALGGGVTTNVGLVVSGAIGADEILVGERLGNSE